MRNGDNIFCSDDDFRDFLGNNYVVKDKTAKGLIKEQLAEEKSTLVTVTRYLGDTAKITKIENPAKDDST